MDLVDSCKRLIQEKLELVTDVDQSLAQSNGSESCTLVAGAEKDKNLDKILNQQAHLKRIIDQDNHIQMLKSSLARVSLNIEELRKQCTTLNEEALKSRQESVETQAKEIDRFQMAQIRSIAEDYARHQQILEMRKKEIQTLRREIEREEKDRDSYLADVQRKLDKQVQDRERALNGGGGGGGLLFASTSNSVSGLTDELHNPDHIELASVDEYAPYGMAPHSRLRGRGGAAATTGGGGGRGRGRRKRG